MARVLFVGYTDQSGLLSTTLLEGLSGALRLAEQLSGQCVVGLIGATVDPALKQVGSCGAERFLAVSGEEFQQSRYPTDAAALEAICREADPDFLVTVGTSRWSRVLPGVAYRLDGRCDTHVVDVRVAEDGVELTRWYYRQRMKAVLTRPARPWCILYDVGLLSPWSGPESEAQADQLQAEPAESPQVEAKEVRQPAVEAQTIRPDAELLFVAGAGWTKAQSDGRPHVQEAEQLILDFLNRSGASLGGSKSMVDLSSEGEKVLSFMTHLNQIGQTGATPRHPQGLATCCHGEEPHVVGWRFVQERRVINMDPNCGWAQGKADVLYVQDAFEVMKRVNELLGERG